jgi:hypothetical protein
MISAPSQAYVDTELVDSATGVVHGWKRSGPQEPILHILGHTGCISRFSRRLGEDRGISALCPASHMHNIII